MRLIAFMILICLYSHTVVGAEEAISQRILPPQQVKVSAPNNFELNAHFFQAEKSIGGVLIFHDCNDTLNPYLALAESFQLARIDALVLNMRGFGGSISELYSHEAIKRKSKDIISYQQNAALLYAFWGDDGVLAFNYLRNKIGRKKPISIVSSGCSAHTAVQVAEKVHVSASVFIEPVMDYMAKEQYKNLIDMPNYFIGSVHQTESFQTAKEMFNWNGDSGSKIQMFKGSIYRTNSKDRSSSLYIDIAKWVAFHSR
ncbi:hypothetical protein [Thalassotalea atypica]|uniref:hypothetical protein n=1 Tax=Thalassotalea atypica TaxID=2054316 RepID=UPI0025729B8C|nr:hypothetical protein [Thalassotalea atypica]